MKKIYTIVVFLVLLFSTSVYAVEEQNHNSSRSNETEWIISSENVDAKALDSHECEKYPDRCPDYKVSEEFQQVEIDDCKWDPAKCRQEAESNNVEALDVHECERYPDRCPDYKVSDEVEANYNNSRSNRSTINSDLEIDDCKWNPAKCKQEAESNSVKALDVHECERYPDRCPDYEVSDEVEVRDLDSDDDWISDSSVNITTDNNDKATPKLYQGRLKISENGELYCWGKTSRECSKEEREQKRESLKEHLQINKMQYSRFKNQFKPRVEAVFERLSEERYERVSQKIARLVEKNQDSENKTMLAAILTLQELLDESR